VMFFLLELGHEATLGAESLPHQVLLSWFFSVTPRSGGFAPLEVSELNDHTRFFLIGLMFIGGGAGSTAGGIKVNTLAVLAVAVLAAARGRVTVVVFYRQLPPFVVMRALTIAVLALLIVLNVALVLTVVEPFPFLDVLFDATSAAGIVGLSTGILPEFTDFSKLVVTAAMFVGRLGPLTLAFVLARREVTERLQFPEDSVRIG
jgi:trk system potassium uptake protein